MWNTRKNRPEESAVPYKDVETCIECGKQYAAYRALRSRKLCRTCWAMYQMSYEEMKSQFHELQRKIRFETALRQMEMSDGEFLMSDLEESIAAVKEMQEIKPDAFNSVAEIITAIFLYNEGYFFKVNYPVLKYFVDFYIPEEKICLEIDGNLHDLNNKRARDGRRDIEVREALGAEWETIRIPTSFVNAHPDRIVEGMLELARKQRKIRKEHNGILPDHYSKTTKAYYNMICPDELSKIYKR